MKFIHTSDWHLGQNFHRYDREDEHRDFFRQLAEIARKEKPDALVVTGDIFHNPIPTAQAQRLLVDGLLELRDAAPDMAIIVTAGNHDSPSRLEAQEELWRRSGIRVIGGCRRGEGGTIVPGNFIVELTGKGTVLAVPYYHPSNYPLPSGGTGTGNRQKDFFETLLGMVPEDSLPVVLTAHLAVDGCDTTGHEDVAVGGMVKESLADLGTGYDYLALGHIHKPQQVSEKAYYSGSPVAVSFSENYPHYVNIVDIPCRGAAHEVRKVEIRQLRSVKTVPQRPMGLDDAIVELSKLPDDDSSYVRLLVKNEGPLPPDAVDRARDAVKEKACRFCEVRVKRDAEKLPEISEVTLEIDEIAALDPMQIALSSFENKFNVPMSEAMANMLLEIINS